MAALNTRNGQWKRVAEHVAVSDADVAAANASAASAAAALPPQGRSSNGAGVIGSQLFVFSGENTPRVPIDDHVHVCDIDSGKWTSVRRPDGQQWPCARIGHASAVVSSLFYIGGGRTGLQAGDATLDDLWRFDPAARQWTLVAPKGQAPPPLSYHVMSAAAPFLYVFGGCTADHGRSNGLWRFDTRSEQWEELWAPTAVADDSESAPCSRGGPSVAAGEDEVFVGFGYNGSVEQSDLWRFDVSARKWSRLQPSGDLPRARSVTDFVMLPDHFGPSSPALFVFGGEFTPSAQGHEGAGEYHADAFLYNVKANAWTSVESGSSSPCARGWFNTIPSSSRDSAVVFGGFSGAERLNDVYIWSPAAPAQAE